MADYKNRAGGRREYGAAPSRRTERRGPAVQGNARRPQTPQHRPAPARQPEAEVEERSLPCIRKNGKNIPERSANCLREVD